MTEVFETYSMDYTSRIERAKNADGVWFTRSQYRDPRYGYKWTAWKRTCEWTPERRGELRKVRLPK